MKGADIMPRYHYNRIDVQRNSNCQSGNTQANCSCMANENSSQKMVLAMAYVPWQRWGNLYDLEQALIAGTIFADLNKPLRETGGCCNGR